MITVAALAFPFTLIFMAFSNQLTWQGFIVGYVLSFGALVLGQAYNLNLKYGRILSQVWNLMIYATRLILDIFVSSVQVAKLVLNPGPMSELLDPVVVKISTQDETKNEITTAMSSHAITITPGQMVIDIEETEDETLLHIHNLFQTETPEQIQAEQARRLHRIRKVLGYE